MSQLFTVGRLRHVQRLPALLRDGHHAVPDDTATAVGTRQRDFGDEFGSLVEDRKVTLRSDGFSEITMNAVVLDARV